MRSDEIQKTIKKGLGNYRVKQVNISGKPYDLYVFSEDEDLNLFEGFLFTEVTEKSELSHLISRYRAPVSGYVPRLSLLYYKNQLIIKDYRKNRLIRKTLRKINKSFISKLKKALTDPDESNFNKLFDRTDIIEEFWILYKKSRDYLLENIKGFSDEDERIAFVDNLMMQMLTLWYLQEKRFFDGDTSYFITKFKDMGQKKLFGGFKNYYEFLTHFFEIIGNNVGNQYYEDDTLGKVVVLGPAIFLNGNIDQAAITIPDRCFYKEGMTDTLINTPPKKVGADVPLFNLFESRDWTEGNIDDFVLGAIYEKLITHIERKKLGAYYTPKEITKYICKNTIEPYLIDKVNRETGDDFKSIDTIVESDDKETLLHLFNSLKEIKILDPAVGSAHFLADAIEVLLSVYEKIWDRAKELGLRRGLEITAADESGRLKNINLLEISDRDQFKIYIKFFIILSKNIYGVDINQSAINVARARLFLSIAKHFDVGKGCFIRFPNVHFNLRRGNSLIGYVGMGEDSGVKQSTFDVFVGEKEAVYAAEPIRVVSELGDYLSETARTLGMDGDILEEIRGLNGILSMERIRWDEFEKVLRVKEKLIRILIASLNSKHAIPLNGLIKNITALFDGKLDERFAREHEIDPDALEEIGTFHWGMEFPEVFLERGGFDVVIGNPPYVRIQIIREENPSIVESFNTLFSSASGNYDIYVIFVEQGLNLVSNDGILSYILPKKFFNASYGKGLRTLIRDKKCLKEAIDFTHNQVFVGATNYTSILTLGTPNREAFRYVIVNDFSNPRSVISKILSNREIRNAEIVSTFLPTEFLDRDPWNFSTIEEMEILDTLTKIGVGLEDACERIFQGLRTSADSVYVFTGFEVKNKYFEVFSDETGKTYEMERSLLKSLVKGKNIKRSRIRKPEKLILFPYEKADTGGMGLISPDIFEKTYPKIWAYLNECKERLENRENGRMRNDKWYGYVYPKNLDVVGSPKIITSDIAYRPTFAYDFLGIFYFTSGYGMIPKQDYLPKYTLLLLNSKLSEFFLRRRSTEFRGGYRSFEFRFIKDLPVYQTDLGVQQKYTIIADYLLFLNQCYYDFYESIGDDNKEVSILAYRLESISNTLIYELYFKEKFHEDELYPEPKEYLSELLSKHLKPISYDRWAELHWKKQLEENLTPEEEKELEELETENTKTIESVHNAIANDGEIQEQIEKIKGHEWVNVIVGGDSQ